MVDEVSSITEMTLAVLGPIIVSAAIIGALGLVVIVGSLLVQFVNNLSRNMSVTNAGSNVGMVDTLRDMVGQRKQREQPNSGGGGGTGTGGTVAK